MWMRYDQQKKKTKKNLIVLILHIHFLIFSLVVVLWGMRRLRERSAQSPAPQVLERKAQFLPASPSKSKDVKKTPLKIGSLLYNMLF